MRTDVCTKFRNECHEYQQIAQKRNKCIGKWVLGVGFGVQEIRNNKKNKKLCEAHPSIYIYIYVYIHASPIPPLETRLVDMVTLHCAGLTRVALKGLGADGAV